MSLASNIINGSGASTSAPTVPPATPISLADGPAPTSIDTPAVTQPTILPARFGQFGG
ncbi:hypothetical protein FRB94_011797 [Tulasnella sp. JGI-2019a]|nr:hypothetical protein FRB94_011797 [Tulasnella sp. JGI-2019a]